MSLPVSKEQILAKMQEFDALFQATVNVRTELWSMIASLSEGKPVADIEIPLTFYENGNVIAWGNDSERFTPSTFRLVQQLWLAPDRTLSKDDVREEVNEDEYASDGAVRHVLFNARQEMENVDFPYEIETLRKSKGYKMKIRNNVTDLRNG
jgi:DNA-binding response OmpR family regulator